MSKASAIASVIIQITLDSTVPIATAFVELKKCVITKKVCTYFHNRTLVYRGNCSVTN